MGQVSDVSDLPALTKTSSGTPGIAAWTPQNHFLVVEIEGKTMRVNPVSYELVTVADGPGQAVKGPIVVTIQ